MLGGFWQGFEPVHLTRCESPPLTSLKSLQTADVSGEIFSYSYGQSSVKEAMDDPI